jgi:hypothetical protein
MIKVLMQVVHARLLIEDGPECFQHLCTVKALSWLEGQQLDDIAGFLPTRGLDGQSLVVQT